MRLFIALELDDEIRAEIFEEIKYLKSHFPKIRWVNPENLHITLKFLGDVEENDIEDICAAIDTVTENREGFSLEVVNLGCFPDMKYPRIVWAGCGEGSAYAADLVKALDDELKDLGFKPENHKYTPHITIGRVKQPSFAKGIETIISDAPRIEFGFLDISNITLFMSELKKTGPVYSPIYKADLKY